VYFYVPKVWKGLPLLSRLHSSFIATTAAIALGTTWYKTANTYAIKQILFALHADEPLSGLQFISGGGGGGAPKFSRSSSTTAAFKTGGIGYRIEGFSSLDCSKPEQLQKTPLLIHSLSWNEFSLPRVPATL